MLRKSALAVFAATVFVLPGCSYDNQASFSPPRAADVGFFYVDEGPSAKLAYGEAQSDNVGLMLACAKGSRQVEITDLVRSEPAPTMTLISGSGRSELKAKADDGFVTAKANTAVPALAGFRKSGKIEVSYAGLRYGVSAKAKERAVIEQFFTACEKRAA